MNKYTGLIIASALVVLIQFTGFPSSWRDLATILAGMVCLIIAVNLYREHLGGFHIFPKNPSSHSSTFVENKETF
ncbi:MAG: hypothetical protein WCI52_03985 [bacterium]